MLKRFLILFVLFPHLLFAQTLKGTITDIYNLPIEAVNVSVTGKQIGVSTNEKGKYLLELKANRSYLISFTFIGYQTVKVRIPILKKGQEYVLNQQMITKSFIKNEIIISEGYKSWDCGYPFTLALDNKFLTIFYANDEKGNRFITSKLWSL